ncbi:MAG: hypothetical protein R3F61_25455 [Myxococcota bacterium]
MDFERGEPDRERTFSGFGPLSLAFGAAAMLSNMFFVPIVNVVFTFIALGFAMLGRRSNPENSTGHAYSTAGLWLALGNVAVTTVVFLAQVFVFGFFGWLAWVVG